MVNTPKTMTAIDLCGSGYISQFTHDDKALQISEVMRLTGLSRSSIYRLMDDPDEGVRFPKNLTLGKRSAVWIEREVYSWIQRSLDRRNTTLRSKGT